MQKVPFQTVQESIDKICNITDESLLENVSQHLFEVQPDLAGFFMEFIEDMSEGAQDLAFMMALILNDAFETQFGTIRALTEDEVVAKFESNEAEYEGYLKLNDEMLEELQGKSSQPDVFNYIVEELFMSPELEPALEADEQIHLFIICKFFMDSLQTAAAPATVHH